AALQQAAKGISFSSAQVLAPLILGPIFLVAFVLWQRFLTSRLSANSINPLLSWNMLSNRVFLAVMFNSWLGGAIMTMSIIQIPQRFVVVNNISPLAAGVRLLPFAITSAVSSLVASSITSKVKIPPVNIMIFGGFLMIAGIVGFSKTPTSIEIWGPQYGFQVLVATGVGIVNIMVILLPPHIVARRDLAVANGAIVQLRFLGGALALAITTCAASPSLQRKLLGVLNVQETDMFLDRTETIVRLSPAKQAVVREINGEYYNLQMTIMIGFAVASVLASVMQWQKKPIIFDG
ncbi:MFS general substrate transporter, partial [Zopfia rhizophila CBS 207.26]